MLQERHDKEAEEAAATAAAALEDAKKLWAQDTQAALQKQQSTAQKKHDEMAARTQQAHSHTILYLLAQALHPLKHDSRWRAWCVSL